MSPQQQNEENNQDNSKKGDQNQTTEEEKKKHEEDEFKTNYHIFVETIFESPNLSQEIRNNIMKDLGELKSGNGTDEPQRRSSLKSSNSRSTKGEKLYFTKCDDETGDKGPEYIYQHRLAVELLVKALSDHSYQIITRFMPPYCSTVTFYKDTIGFVTVSALKPEFELDITTHGKERNIHLTVGAIHTLMQAYKDTIVLHRSKTAVEGLEGPVENPRDIKAHQEALEKRQKIQTEEKKNHATISKLSEYNQMFIRIEGKSPEFSPKTILEYGRADTPSQTDSGVFLKLFRQLYLRCIEDPRLLIHRLLIDSKINFSEGPGAVWNDYFHYTHDGKYAHNTRIIEGELSGRLNWFGRRLATISLNATNVIISAAIALFSSAKGVSQTGLIVSGAVLLGFRLWQNLWSYFITSCTFENIENNDFRMRNIPQANTLFGLRKRNLQLFLAMISPITRIDASGFKNTYIDIARTGVLEVSDTAPAEIIYFAGYVTSALETKNSTIAAWIPFDTDRITYPSNDKIREMSLIKNTFRLRHPGKLEWSTTPRDSKKKASDEDPKKKPSGEDPKKKASTGEQSAELKDEQVLSRRLVLRRDGDILELPERLCMYGKTWEYLVG
ncbi:hypothetical protein MAA_10545 [Metarhizium robertsii ARSEF 23]|uniref:Uncharacterized protein n=1 Tax=Metarhizium robertsii (strain ARSEF 23 / ATCC MYA-3075) TaxID=655844 RepID=E9FE46_METRA|nr:uncharacterized protein MAA_10545 [Metarhizium robertsii ARSEF 23]EFY93994.1 hypothetical protein MAA_10545 [Metarhizium robertsii ARSEF 23]